MLFSDLKAKNTAFHIWFFDIWDGLFSYELGQDADDDADASSNTSRSLPLSLGR